MGTQSLGTSSWLLSVRGQSLEKQARWDPSNKEGPKQLSPFQAMA